jgi:uncharacterized protein (DUF1800 family)
MLEPLPPGAWAVAHAEHLLQRAGFGGTPGEIRAFHALGLPRAVAALFSADAPQRPPPDWTRNGTGMTPRKMVRMVAGPEPQRDLIRQARKEEHEHLMELRSWWLGRMLERRRPLLEKMTLFWHGHFATSNEKVQNAWKMWRQNETLRACALGSFREMLRAISRDPAMIRWLDLGLSTATAPNENFARELMELFTLGEGHYTEQDIKQAARAFTGYRTTGDGQTFFLARRAHDYGPKTFMGRTGNFNGDDILDIILAQPRSAEFLARRIWEFFVAENPRPEQLQAAASVLRVANYDIPPLLRAIFQSRDFYDPRVMRGQIKSPVAWLVSSCIALGSSLPEQPALDFLLTQLGQLPFAPPNVRGWEGGRTWISSSTLMLRYNLSGWLAGVRELGTNLPRRVPQPKPATIVDAIPGSLRTQPEPLADALVLHLFGMARLPRMRQLALEMISEMPLPISDRNIRTLCQRLMSSPDFQLT